MGLGYGGCVSYFLDLNTRVMKMVTNMRNRPQWSYKKGLAAGVLPPKAYEKSFDCTGGIPSFSDLPEYY